MSVNLRWVGEADYDRVAEARLLCYGKSPSEIDWYKQGLLDEPRGKPGDFLLAEEGADVVGTATVYPFTTWVRGAALPCQGVAYVGTVRTRRRGKPGVATVVMNEVLADARRRGQVLSALMPFRASYYEHFGYGVVERRSEWTVPLAVLPQGDFAGIRYAKPGDRAGVAACHQRSVERGQCDMERSPERWTHIAATFTDGFELVDSDGPGERVRASLFYNQYAQDGKDYIRVLRLAWDDTAAFRKLLHFFASLKDQYYGVTITLAADLALEWLLKERQLPHRLVNHPHAVVRNYTRMQVRVLDHARLLNAMILPGDVRGDVVVAVHESEGHVSKFRVRIEGGRADVAPSDATPDVECSDVTWAAVALGNMSVRRATEWGLMSASGASDCLRAFTGGPIPFCEEYF